MELCPACGQIGNVVISNSTRSIIASSGKKKAIKTISYHCERCGQFIRSEEKEKSTA